MQDFLTTSLTSSSTCLDKKPLLATTYVCWPAEWPNDVCMERSPQTTETMYT